MEPDDKPGSSRPQQPGTDAVNTLAGAQYASPQCDVPTGGLPPQPASHWDRLREEPACKRSRVLEAGETSSSCELHADADIGSVQREVLNKIISTLDTSNSSVVITNPLRRGAPAPATRGAPPAPSCSCSRAGAHTPSLPPARTRTHAQTERSSGAVANMCRGCFTRSRNAARPEAAAAACRCTQECKRRSRRPLAALRVIWAPSFQRCGQHTRAAQPAVYTALLGGDCVDPSARWGVHGLPALFGSTSHAVLRCPLHQRWRRAAAEKHRRPSPSPCTHTSTRNGTPPPLRRH
jgi:hypothetical protein